ncbi:hypothetical protein SAMN02746089_01642 [Caldanaerobius fijiensis DSM 17918]|uniref:Uncharacterized protein n=1 Tax=Caldanaerobius fijiensis DSM 17918 TaxID=1121256 RepID=A0A1M5AI29_9THEO|nr:hypothetical protein [Caldanaerobius fijiensis]SHF29542.1 hypothetical protein SAMN02746089_01642 [Caldanaerobius fijiensis DSM 17918]
MDFLRAIVNSDDLSNIIRLPDNLKHKKVEILILPLETAESNNDIKNFRGIFRKYKNTKLINMEHEAWQKAVEEKYGNN